MRKPPFVQKSAIYAYLHAHWRDLDAVHQVIDGYYQNQLGMVIIYGQRDQPDGGDPFLRYEFIHNGARYMRCENVSRTEHGIACVASRFARDVVTGRYDQ